MTAKSFPKIYWFCPTPTPYNDFLFENFSRESGVELIVLYYSAEGTEHEDLLKKTKTYLWRVSKVSFLFSTEFWSEIRNGKSIFIVGGWGKLIYLALLFFFPSRSILWCDTPKTVENKFNIKRKCLNFILKNMFRSLKAVMGTGYPALIRLEDMGCPKEKLINFPYWVEVPKALPYKSDRSSSGFVILAVGRLIRIKCFDHMIDLGISLRKNNCFNFKIKIIGDGPEYDHLRNEIKEKQLEENLELGGWQNNEDVLSEIRNCDIFVHPALWEPYGVVVLEAMAQGKIVITSNLTMAGLDRIITGENGYLYKWGDIETVVDIILQLIKDENKMEVIGRNAFIMAQEWKVGRSVKIIKNILNC